MADVTPVLTETPQPDHQFSLMERGAATLILTFIILLLGAILGNDIAPGNFLSESYQLYFIEPHSLDSTTGDAGYNPVDTIVYSLLLVSFVVVLSAWLRKIGVPARDSSILALLPWVVWAALGEVNEDGQLFDTDGVGGLYVSPLIHFHVAAWVILTGWMSHSVSKKSGDDNRIVVTQLAVILVIFQMVLFMPQFTRHWEQDAVSFLTSPLFLAPLGGLLVVLIIHPLLECCTAMEQGLLQVGLGGCFMHLSAWLMLYIEPLNNHTPISIVPLALIVIGPLVLCILLWFSGQEARSQLHHMGLEPGIVPEGISLDDWDRQHSSTWERMEALTPRAVLGQSVVLLAMYGQMVDGLATSVGLENYGYGEKHVLSQKVIDIAGTAWGFGVLKFALAGLIAWLFASARFETRHRHLRLLVILCLLVVGLAPGLRDVLRMTLDV
ncbi:MAG: DUF63 family protein [Candidatus Thermoplasmatota archaeon]|nr:DUF63 family protein [Candidatus Thermoplasmatota archaeon]MEE3083374.1 DUF63 family protein [Candidatus Thermoplasmatota archaeon]